MVRCLVLCSKGEMMEYKPHNKPIKTITVSVKKLKTVLMYINKGAPEIAKKYLKEILNEQST